MKKTNKRQPRGQRSAPSQAQQDEAYHHGYNSWRPLKGFANPYDSDKFWLLFMAYEQGWNAAVAAYSEASPEGKRIIERILGGSSNG